MVVEKYFAVRFVNKQKKPIVKQLAINLNYTDSAWTIEEILVKLKDLELDVLGVQISVDGWNGRNDITIC